MNPFSSTRISAAITVLLGVLAIVLPYQFSSAAVMLLAALVLASGIVGIAHVSALRRAGMPAGLAGSWAQVVAGLALLIWPGAALWLVAVLLGGGLIVSGALGLSALKGSDIVNPAPLERFPFFAMIALGVLLILMGAAGSALLLGIILGIALISSGVQQWQLAGRLS